VWAQMCMKNSMCVGRLPTEQSPGLAPQAAVAFAVAARRSERAAAAAPAAAKSAAATVTVMCASHHVPARLQGGSVRC
jgi:hypothetical protein